MLMIAGTKIKLNVSYYSEYCKCVKWRLILFPLIIKKEMKVKKSNLLKENDFDDRVGAFCERQN